MKAYWEILKIFAAQELEKIFKEHPEEFLSYSFLEKTLRKTMCLNKDTGNELLCEVINEISEQYFKLPSWRYS